MASTLRKEDIEKVLTTNVEDKIKDWVKEVCDSIWQNNNAFMVSSAANSEKKEFFVVLEGGIDKSAPRHTPVKIQIIENR